MPQMTTVPYSKRKISGVWTWVSMSGFVAWNVSTVVVDWEVEVTAVVEYERELFCGGGWSGVASGDWLASMSMNEGWVCEDIMLSEWRRSLRRWGGGVEGLGVLLPSIC